MPQFAFYAIVDSASSPDLFPQLMQFPRQAKCLYSGDIAPKIRSAAPYLIPLVKGSDLLAWWHEQCRKLQNGSFACKTRVPQESLQHHFKSLLQACLPTGKKCFFRFWDPHVLPIYLSACNTYEKAAFMGPMETLYMASSAHGPIKAFHNPLAKHPHYNPYTGPVYNDGVPIFQAVLHAFAPSAQGAMVATLCKKARKHLKAWSTPLSDGEMERLIQWAIPRAERYGFKTVESLWLFLVRMVSAGPRFDQIPEINAILTDSSLDTAGKAHAMAAQHLLLVWPQAKSFGMAWAE
ncbi:DUF4123 domain-containing protein [Acidithiobacillus ferrivorans]|uniref:DUF4123 domain-containing protein n=1 Tax=Acidithiobacillus ferrivorans TaxID=160808 RepID=A0A7T4WFH6_9PROT|nr:DUF4123 domain-containing protein [Acidithiobacillus ferrivorans]QQD73622.1 DUF4123 domain-containing protein [Acidithiobacillus ferrivorans]